MESLRARKQIKPTTNVIQISSKRDTGFYVFIAKLFLMDFETIELHGLGDAITICVKVGEALTRYGYTTVNKISTSTLTPTEDANGPKRGKKAKLILTLGKSDKFPELISNFKIDNKKTTPEGK